ncbi:hypothetical protein EDB81DRAFT_195561 [Dactylonectria macrodidyma]|uniref:DUF7082 domain-containing protein n=1 Tax=Dactylonectria macrodidyma TaxID=307937 RepID=A0A9P9FT73_9HYPO|nr:hypothetical protein EDB81DRAFT_195561 [Dactylonectria macrodidyma]
MSSAVKFQCPPYKLFEPDYHTQKPIIVGLDDRLESPETITLRFEEVARAANGGDPRGDSPPQLLEMATYSKAQLPSMHAYDSPRYQEPSYEQYPAQTFPSQQTEKFAQLNQQSFASNNGTVTGYMPSPSTILSYQPTSGAFGTKVYVKVSSQYDVLSMSAFFSLLFGTEKCPAEVTREGQDSSGYTYTFTADVPQHLVTGCPSGNVPVSLLHEANPGEEISRTAVGTFQYLDVSGDGVTGSAKGPKQEDGAPATALDQPSISPKSEAVLPSEPATNSYEYPAQPSGYASNYPSGNNEMITTYRSTSFTDPGNYHRQSRWSGYPSTLGSTGRSPAGLDVSMAGRPSLTPLPIPSTTTGTPQLIRTSTISNSNSGGSSYHSVSMYGNKAVLKIQGKLDSMAENWSQEEWDNRRRIVRFQKNQRGSTLTASFAPVAVNERPPNSICISCIWWAEKTECYVTSVDTIHLLEQLVAAPNRFSVEEKNRIRRNLEGFHPLTVSKAKPESEEFFKIIMAFPNPKPRNIEKDVKVFPWKILEPALKKIIGKYSATPSSTLPPAAMLGMNSSSYAPLPTPPGQSIGPSQADPHTQYSLPQHHDSIPSPRSLSGSQPSWTPYSATAPGYPTAASRTMSPSIRHPSPSAQPPLRLSTTPLPSVSTYDSRTGTAAAYGTTGLHTPISHHQATATPPRWDPTPATYPDSYPSLTSQTAQPVYSSGAYGEAPSRG